MSPVRRARDPERGDGDPVLLLPGALEDRVRCDCLGTPYENDRPRVPMVLARLAPEG